ncbi:unnamed protein product [Rotaria sp. Silwood1]|nr:unnamed protein product [Rotaria sp. Silwood1]
MGDTNGQVVAGGNGRGNRLDHLNEPSDVLIDKETDNLFICDLGNGRVVRWYRRSGTTQGEILLDNIDCFGLAMDDQRYLYISDTKKHEEDRNELKPWFPFLKLFDTALNKLPTIKGIVWRAVPGNVVTDYKKDQVLTWWTISSCSVSADVVKEFLKPNEESTLFMIEVINAKNLDGYTMYPNEHEVILGIGTQLRVKSIGFQHGNLYLAHLEEVNINEDNQQEEVTETMATAHMTSKTCKSHSVPTFREL